MEEGVVTISRAQKSIQFPARFMLIAAMNPCPCGYYNHPNIDCHCSPTAIQKYRFRISGPLLDRIDLQMEVTPVAYEALRGKADIEIEKETSTTFQAIETARKIQLKRYQNEINTFDNARLNASQLAKFCPLDKESELLLKKAMQQFQLSARAFDRIIKVSRTIADLATSKHIEPMHIAEAIQFRNFDRGAWGQYKN
jgi:magnesium chelatase family protein